MGNRLILPARLERKDTGGGRHEIRSYTLQIKATGDDGTVEGYGSVFGVRDSYEDVIAPGAFAASLAEHRAAGTMPAMLWQHDSRHPVGVWMEMSEDARGLRVVGKLALNTDGGRNAYELLKMGAVTGLSIGFRTRLSKYDEVNETRTLLEVELWEVSLVTFPANAEARVTGVKGLDIDSVSSPKDAERLLREAGLLKSDATAFVSRVMRMGEERREATAPDAQLHAAADRLLAALKSK